MNSRITLLASIFTVLVGAHAQSSGQNYQYNVFVKGFKPRSTAEGVGDGGIVVNPGDGTDEGTRGPHLVVTPKALSFTAKEIYDDSARAQVGLAQASHFSSEPKTITLTNEGAFPAVLDPISTSKNFDVTSNCPAQLASGESCLITAKVKTTTSGTLTDLVSFHAVGTTTFNTFALTAEVPAGPAPHLVFSPSALAFGAMSPGVSAKMVSVLKNTGSVDADLSTISTSKNFAVTHDCPVKLAPGSSCNITATFLSADSTVGDYSFSLVIPETSASSAALPMTAKFDIQKPAAYLSVSPTLLDFGTQTPGAVTTKTATVTNSGTLPANLTAIISKDGFTNTSDCGITLPAGGSCTISSEFSSVVGGSHNQSLVVGVQGDAPVYVLLSAALPSDGDPNGGLTFSPSHISFESIPVGSTVQKSTTITNSSASAIALESLAFDPQLKDITQVNYCAPTLKPGDSCTVTLSYSPTGIAQPQTALLLTQQGGQKASVSIVGQSVAAYLTAPSSLDFGTVHLTQSATRPITVLNSGNIPLQGLSASQPTGPYSVSNVDCGTVLAPKEHCSLMATFTPTSSGPSGSVLTLSASNAGSADVQLSGAGTTAQLEVGDDILAFPKEALGTSAPAQVTTLKNVGNDPADFTGISIVGGAADFGQSNNCGTSLAAGASCQVSVSFRPTKAQVSEGSVAAVLKDGSVSSVKLIGEGFDPNLTVTPSSLIFPETNVGETSATSSVQLANTSDSPVEITGISVVNGVTVFGQENNCGTTLNAGATCAISVAMTPTSTTGVSGSIVVRTSIGDYTIALGGSVTQPKLSLGGNNGTGNTSTGSPTDTAGTGSAGYSVAFDDTAVLATSPSRSLTFSNVGTGVLRGISISVAGSSQFNQTSNCPAELAAGASCIVTLTFTPQATGLQTGTLHIDTKSGSMTAALSGNGVLARAAWSSTAGSDFGATLVGATKQKNFTLKNTGTSTMAMTASLSGQDLGFTLNNCGTPEAPVTLRPSEYCVVTVAYSPSSNSTLVDGAVIATSPQMPDIAKIGLTGSGSSYGVGLAASPSQEFGTASVGLPFSRVLIVKNLSALSDKIAVAPTLSTPEMAITATTCSVGTNIAGKGSCTVTVQANPATSGSKSGVLTLQMASGAKLEEAVTMNVAQNTLELSDSANASSGSLSAPPGAVPGATSKIYYYLRDPLGMQSPVVTNATVLGSSNFVITAKAYLNSAGSTVSASSCNTIVCTYRMEVTFTGLANGAPSSATLHVEHSGIGGVTEGTITGNTLFDVEAQVQTNSHDFSSVAVGAASVGYQARVDNIGKYGALVMSAEIIGDGEFYFSKDTSSNVALISTSLTQSARLRNNRPCLSGGQLSDDLRSFTACTAEEVSLKTSKLYAGSYPPLTGEYVYGIIFQPSSAGPKSAVLRIYHNALNMPSPIEIPLTGTGK